jgi:hypothetical protein
VDVGTKHVLEGSTDQTTEKKEGRLEDGMDGDGWQNGWMDGGWKDGNTRQA